LSRYCEIFIDRLSMKFAKKKGGFLLKELIDSLNVNALSYI